MADPGLTGALDSADVRRLMAAACANIHRLETELNRSRAEARQLHAEAQELRAEARQLHAEAQELRNALSGITTSRAWSILQRYHHIRSKVRCRGVGVRSLARWVLGRARRAPEAPVTPGVPEESRAPAPVADAYQAWIAHHEPRAFAALPAAPVSPDAAPLINILLTGEGSALHASVRSVLAQTDPHWRLCVAAAGPFQPEDGRIRAVALPESASCAEAWNASLGLANDGFVAVLRQGDLLAPPAVAALRHALVKDSRAGMIYSDEDALDEAGRRRDPLFKPDWAPDAFRAMNYVGNPVAVPLALVREVGGFRPGFGEAALYDLLLRVTEKTDRIIHVPLVLYHGRRPAAESTDDHAAAVRAVQEHLDRLAIPAEVAPGLAPGSQEVRYQVGRPLASILVPSRDQPRLLERCVESILAGSYPFREILVIDTGSVTEEARAANARLAGRPGVRLLRWDRPFNYSAVNNYAVGQARGEILAFVNDDAEVLTPDWLERMAEHALRPEVGAVGAKLLYPGGTIQHAGVVLGIKDKICGHIMQHCPGAAPGYAGRLAAVQNFSAVTAACLVMRRPVFDEVGGFEERFAGDYNDVDLCLKVRQRGYRVVWTPHARLVHHECQTRGHIVNPARRALFTLERLLFLDRWGDAATRGDPYYSPHLNHDEADCSVRS